MENLTTKLLSVALTIFTLPFIGCASTNTSTLVKPSVSDNVIGATTKEILVAESMRLPIIKADPSLTDSQKQCIDEVNLTKMAKKVQGMLRNKFTENELSELDKFFDSESAKAASKATRRQIANLLSGGDMTQGVKLTPKQEADIVDFTNSALGKEFEQATKSDGDISITISAFVTESVSNCGV